MNNDFNNENQNETPQNSIENESENVQPIEESIPAEPVVPEQTSEASEANNISEFSEKIETDSNNSDTAENIDTENRSQDINAADSINSQSENYNSEQTHTGGYNSQYTYNNINPEPKNYYGQQKHYIPNDFNPQFGGFAPNTNIPEQPQNKPPKNNGKKGLIIFLSILCAVAVFISGAALGKIVQSGGLVSTTQPTTSTNDTLKYQGEDIEVNSGNSVKRDDIKPDENGMYTADQVAQLVSDSVVNIRVYSETDKSAGAIASGVILNDQGYIITNDHIYSSVTNAKFVVTTNSGNSYKASYIAGDTRSDIAVLKFDEVPKDIVAATFADSSSIKAGDEVIAIGSPYGFSSTVTKGIVSYPSRRLSLSSQNSSGSANYSMRVIQTDVALNSGNSGGALVNMYGQVIGISSSKIAITGYEGLCFAIPSNDAVKYAKSLVKNGVVTGRAKLGITYTEVDSATALVNNMPAGLLIQEINEDSELYSQGIATGTNGDIITKINGKAITKGDIALDIIDDSTAGDTVELEIYDVDKDKTNTYKVKLLEDKSNTSYVNEIPKSNTTTSPYYNYNYDFGN